MSLTSYQAAPPRVLIMTMSCPDSHPKKNDCRSACEVENRTCRGRRAAQNSRRSRERQTKIQRSSVVERSAVNRLVVGSNPTAGAVLIYLTDRSCDLASADRAAKNSLRS